MAVIHTLQSVVADTAEEEEEEERGNFKSARNSCFDFYVAF